MIGIDPEVALHCLQGNLEHLPVKKNRRKFTSIRNPIMNEEIQKLINKGSMRKVQYLEWHAHVVLVRKNRKWHICINFTDLNKACPKDSFPLPHMDMLVDAKAGHELLSIMDVFSRYNQILMHLDD